MLDTLKAYNIIEDALQNAGGASFGESIDPNLAARALRELNSIRRQWSIGGMGYKRYDQTYQIAANTKSITVGTGGNITTRPALLSECTIIYGANNFKRPILTLDEYRAIPFVDVYSIPTAVFWQDDYPLAQLWAYPGFATGYSVRIVGQAYLADYENVADTIKDPPEYYQAAVSVLALKMAQLLGFPTDGLIQIAHSAQKSIKAHNAANNAPQGSTMFGNAANAFSVWAGM